MKPASFDYLEAHSVEEALSMLAEHGDEAKVLAGGQSLVPAMNFRLARPAVLIDINRIEQLDFMSNSGEVLTIGSLVRHQTLQDLSTGGPLESLLRMAANHVGHLPIRVRGTFGGSLAHADPAAEWCVLAALLDAEIVAQSSEGSRVIPASDFFQTVFTTALRPDELLVEARLPVPPSTTRTGFSEFSRRVGDFALTMTAVAIDLDGEIVKSARLALGGVRDQPLRATNAESHLQGERLTDKLVEEASHVAASEIDPFGDIHGSAEYRRDLVRALTKRSLRQVITR